MPDLSAFWSSAMLVNFAIGLSLVEWLGLVLYRRYKGRGLQAHDYALNLVAGVFLMLAVRSALLGHAWFWGALCMSASGALHVLDLRWRGQRQRHWD